MSGGHVPGSQVGGQVGAQFSGLPPTSAVARLQQFAGLWLLGWTLGLTAWGWQSEQVSAAWGLLPSALAVGVLALQFAMAYGVNAAQGVAAWSWRGLFRAMAGECVAATAVFGWRQPWAWRSNPAPAPASAHSSTSISANGAVAVERDVPRGVLLVHGYLCNRGLWSRWFPLLASHGHAVEAVNMEPVWGSIDDYVPTLEAAVARLTERTGQPPLVVTHSMGGLAVRAWMRAQAGNAERVAHVVTIGTPHHGTWLAQFGLATNTQQMRLDSPWLRELAASEPPQQAARFTCWHSEGDNIVFPMGTAVLAGATAHALPHVGHVALVDDPRVQASVLDWLARHNGH